MTKVQEQIAMPFNASILELITMNMSAEAGDCVGRVTFPNPHCRLGNVWFQFALQFVQLLLPHSGIRFNFGINLPSNLSSNSCHVSPLFLSTGPKQPSPPALLPPPKSATVLIIRDCSTEVNNRRAAERSECECPAASTDTAKFWIFRAKTQLWPAVHKTLVPE